MAMFTLKSFTGVHQLSTEQTNFVSHLSSSLSRSQRQSSLRVTAARSSPKLSNRNLRVTIIGGGPADGTAAETLTQRGIETILIERKMDNCKLCGGVTPLCMVGEFNLPAIYLRICHRLRRSFVA